VYWTGAADVENDVSKVVHPKHTAGAGHYEVDRKWLHDFWLDLARSGQSIRVQVHTHAGIAFHSASDDAWPVIHTPGFRSLVLPNHALGNNCLSEAFLAELDKSGRWSEVAVPSRLDFQ
jgi:hypothetical protein